MSAIGLMVTNGGAHPPEKLAAMTVSQLIQIASNATGAAVNEGRKLELKIIEILEDAHRLVQSRERDELTKGKGHARLDDRLDINDVLEPTVASILAAAATTHYKDHFQQQHVRDHVRQVVGQQLTNNMHIERLWHADRNPNRPESKRYKERHANVQVPALGN